MSFGQDVKDVMKEVPEVAEAVANAISTLSRLFGWNRRRAAQAFAAHVDPSKPVDAKVAAALDSEQPNPVE